MRHYSNHNLFTPFTTTMSKGNDLFVIDSCTLINRVYLEGCDCPDPGSDLKNTAYGYDYRQKKLDKSDLLKKCKFRSELYLGFGSISDQNKEPDAYPTKTPGSGSATLSPVSTQRQIQPEKPDTPQFIHRVKIKRSL